MDITISERKTVIVIAIDGELNALTAQDLAEQLAKSVRRSTNIIIDMARLRYISSAGIHVLFAALKACRQRGGDLRLVGFQKNVQHIMTTSGLGDTAKSFNDIDSATDSFTDLRGTH